MGYASKIAFKCLNKVASGRKTKPISYGASKISITSNSGVESEEQKSKTDWINRSSEDI